MIWQDNGWVIIDTGGIEDTLSEQEIVEKYLEQLTRRYTKVFVNYKKGCNILLRNLAERLSSSDSLLFD
jgi:hypothetical protein